MELKKELNLLHVFAIASAGMISAGLFILPGLAHDKAGPGAIVSYLLAGLLALTGMLSQAELASAMPKSGGTYFYVTRSMGPAVGTMYGLITWFSLCLKSAFALVGIGAVAALVTDVDVRMIVIPVCMLFVLINIFGVDLAGRIQVILIFTILGALGVLVVAGLPHTEVRHFQPFAPRGIGAIFSTAGLVFICYGGLLKVPSVAEEVKNPGRAIPYGMILALVVVLIFYSLVILVTIGVLESSALDMAGPGGGPTRTPISDAAAVFLGWRGKAVISVVAVLAFISASNAGIMAASRYPLALARDDLLPGGLGRVHGRFKTPHVSIVLTGGLIVLALFLDLEVLVKAASSVLILTYVFTCLSIIILRESRLQNYQPQFRAPWYPWLELVGLVGFVLMLVAMGSTALLTSSALVVVGLFVYWFYGRIRTTREFALLHLIERITAKELTSHSLEAELKEIIRERDDLLKDRFDHLVEAGHVLDLEGTVTMDGFFRQASREMAQRLDIEPEALLKLFLDRERESTTVLNPFLAIPHIVVAGEQHFDILIARCREGIAFSEAAPRVHAVFALVGTRDERPFHLQSLAAIAAIVQDGDFEENWLSAKTGEVLRDIMLLGKRRRDR